jgi:hypothetical protein
MSNFFDLTFEKLLLLVSRLCPYWLDSDSCEIDRLHTISDKKLVENYISNLKKRHIKKSSEHGKAKKVKLYYIFS